MLWLWNFFLEKRQFSYVLIITLVVAGTYALINIPKDVNPPINIPEGVVITALPGATAADTETLVTNKLEDKISSISNIDTMQSDSKSGLSTITVQFDADANIDQSIQSLRDAVAKAAPELPTEATTPSVTKVSFTDTPILLVSVSAHVPPLILSHTSQTVANALKRVSGVSSVNVAGVPDRQISIVVNKKLLNSYHLSLLRVMSAVRAANAQIPVGNISTDGVSYNLNFKGAVTTASQLRNVVVAGTDGSLVYLRDIAQVFDGLAPAASYSRLSVHGGPSQNAITFSVFKQSSARTLGVVSAVRQELALLKRSTLSGFTVYVSPATDLGVQVNKRLGQLAETGVETFVLVLIVLLITIGWREALVAALSIPISFLIAFIGLDMTGNTLNFISLFALILAVGILVDSGIVVTEAIHARMRGRDALGAAHQALSDYAWPLVAGTTATIAVFIPLFFLSGIVGKFIAGIPYTVIFVLVASIFVALGFVPLLAISLSKKHRNRFEEWQEYYTNKVTQWYTHFLRNILEHRRTQNIFILSLTGLFFLSLALPSLGMVQTSFLPQDNKDFVLVDISMPQGTTLDTTNVVAQKAEAILRKDPDIASLQTTVGQSSVLVGDPLTHSSSATSLANIVVNLPIGHKKTSTEMIREIQQLLAPVSTGATVQVLQETGGPPSGAPVQIEFLGQNLNNITTAANRGAHLLATIPGVTNLTSSTQHNGIEFDIAIDRAKAAAEGITTSAVAQTLHGAIHGTKIFSITKPNQTIDVVVKMNISNQAASPSDTTRATIDAIKNLTIKGVNGPVPLSSLISVSLAQSNASIVHKNKIRMETISAYPAANTTTSAIVYAFQSKIGTLHLPAGVSVSYGGDTKNINKTFSEMFIALIAGLVLMFMILVVAFNSFRYTTYLILIVPLSLIGVLDGLSLTGQPISFPALLGVVALGGVIINHAIILMDAMIHRLREMPDAPMEAVIKAATTRLRPIVLTTVTTVIAMIPLSMTNATWSPLAFSIMFGLTFAIVLTLILTPVLFYRAHAARVETVSKSAEPQQVI